MKKHKGEIIEIATRKSGYTLKEIAKRMNISRSTLYNRFKDIDISDDFILKLSRVIHYDFSIHFPHLKEDNKDELSTQIVQDGSNTYERLNIKELLLVQKKYYQLLERHNRLLKVVMKITSMESKKLSGLKKEIACFMEERH